MTRPLLTLRTAAGSARTTALVTVMAAGLIGIVAASAPRVAVIAAFVTLVLIGPRWLLLVGAMVLLRTSIAEFDVVGSFSLALPDALLGLWVLRRFAQPPRPHLLPDGVALLAFFAVLAIATLRAGNVGGLLALAHLFMFATVALLGIGSPVEAALVRAGIVIFAVVEAVATLLSSANPADGLTLQDPHQVGLLALAGLVVVLTWRPPHGFGRFVQVVTAVVLVVAALDTGRRIVALGLVVIGLLLLSRRLSGRRVFAVIVVAVGAGLLLYAPLLQLFGRPSSSELRSLSRQRAVHAFLDEPVMGRGWGAAADDAPVPFSNAPQFVLDQTDTPYGLVFFVALSGGVIGIAAAVWYGRRLSGRFADSDRAAVLFIAVFLAASVTESTVYPKSTVSLLFFYFAGMLALERTRPREQRALISARR
jgi:hypothetical protein